MALKLDISQIGPKTFYIFFLESTLRYYATSKVRKLMHFCSKKLPLHWIADRANILCKYVIYFFNFGCAFAASFLCYFQKLQLLVVKKFWSNFCFIVLLFLWSEKVSQIFKTLFQTRDINIFVLRGVFFSGYLQLKSSFSDVKNIWDKL